MQAVIESLTVLFTPMTRAISLQRHRRDDRGVVEKQEIIDDMVLWWKVMASFPYQPAM